MKLLLLCLGLTLVCAHFEDSHDVVTSDFDMSKISGEWYTILLASDVKEKVEENGGMRMSVEYIQALDNSSLLLKYHKKIDGECTELTFICDETEEKGVYSVLYNGYNRLQVTEAVYDNYYILYVLNYDNEKIIQLMELNARNPDVSLELKERFQKLCENRGIPKENVMDLTNADRCLHARGSHGA